VGRSNSYQEDVEEDGSKLRNLESAKVQIDASEGESLGRERNDETGLFVDRPTSQSLFLDFPHKQGMPLVVASFVTAVLLSSSSYLVAHIVRNNAKKNRYPVTMSSTIELPTDFAPMKNDLILRAARGQSWSLRFS
jgi:hypothetical protein